MNKVVLIGRLTKDPDIRYSSGDKKTCIARYSLAVNRSYKRDGEPDADFFNCVAFGKPAEFVEKYLKKGIKIAIEGELRQNTYEKDGQKRSTVEVVAVQHEFCETKGDNKATSEASKDEEYTDVNPEDLPFA